MNKTGMNVPNMSNALPHVDTHGLHQTLHMVCQNDSCTKPSVKMTFPDPYHEQHWHECPKSTPNPPSGHALPPPNLTYNTLNALIGPGSAIDFRGNPYLEL